MIPLYVTLVIIIIIGCIITSIMKPRKFPPGPKWYPFVGSSYVVRRLTAEYGSQFKALLELSKEHSTQVLGLKFGNELVVAVFGERNVRQVFTAPEFDGRPTSFFIKLRCLGKRLGITFTDGPLWRIHRQFTAKQLRNVGFGKMFMEKEIQNEMQSILGHIQRNNFKRIQLKGILAASVMNVLWKYVAGEKIQEDKLAFLLELMSVRSKAFTMTGGLLNQMPWCRFIIPEISGYNVLVRINKQISEIIEEAIKKHKDKIVKGNDFIYSYFERTEDNANLFTEEQLIVICLDLLIAGSQTTSNYLEFAILALLRNKTIQEKVCDEINRVIGKNTPCWSDSHRLTYTSAFLLEVQRCYPITPLAGPRRVLEETVVDGYVIPKNTTVLISVGDIHVDPELWDNPREFNPDRFLDKAGTLKHSEHMYPFGLGRRRCLGDSLAKSFVFITLVGILQMYQIECSNGVLPSDEPNFGLISSPKPFAVDFIPRI